MVEIEHGNGLSTRFAHLSRIAVVEGQKVERGDVVGVVGSSGRSTSPHMHYEVRRGGETVDPLRFIKLGRKLDQFL
jgi:murein DD-endopeptidase MepM/ murein hydrolase activator NlpD